MRIVHLTTFLQGGAGRLIVGLARIQQAAGHEVVVVADAGGEPGYASYPDYLDALGASGIAVHTVSSTFKRDLMLNLQAVKQLRALLPGGADLIHAHAAVPALVGRLAFVTRATPIPLVETMHGWGTGKSAEQAYTDVEILNLADAVVTVSAADQDRLLRLGVCDPPMHVIRCGIESAPVAMAVEASDERLFDRIRRDGGRIVLCVGTINARKNQALLVAAMALLRKASLHAVFVGDGAGALLEEQAVAHGVADRVHVLGYRAEAARYLSWADALVLPSRNEGLPLAILEAFREGVPVVASRLPEMAETIQDGTSGLLFEPDSASSLAATLMRVVSLGPEERAALTTDAKRRFLSRHTIERMAAAYELVYASVTRPLALAG